ncbi:MAG: metal-dependent transcriptional regulator [Anaerolineae bacterium]|nr:metal-dependent transcriptional regulator [Anaerolineae bacterium]
MVRERFEEYLGAIYRLREAGDVPLPLSQLVDYFNFSPVSVHEMVQKLADRMWVTYHPYRGVILTPEGEDIARALLRRHRLWERFLTDMLQLPWSEVHHIAERLEHAAPESVTERLAGLLGDPEHCPHGSPIPPYREVAVNRVCLDGLSPGTRGEIVRISPESQSVLQALSGLGIELGSRIEVRVQNEASTCIVTGAHEVNLPEVLTQRIWVRVVSNEAH